MQFNNKRLNEQEVIKQKQIHKIFQTLMAQNPNDVDLIYKILLDKLTIQDFLKLITKINFDSNEINQQDLADLKSQIMQLFVDKTTKQEPNLTTQKIQLKNTR